MPVFILKNRTQNVLQNVLHFDKMVFVGYFSGEGNSMNKQSSISKKELAQFKKIAEANKDERRKQTISIRLSPQALRKARSLGKGYTSVLGRILEDALNDNEVIKRNL